MGLFSKLTGKDRTESWKLLSEEMGAQFIDRGMLKGGPKIVAAYKNWEIEMDMYTETHQNNGHNTSTNYTRIVAPFVKQNDYTITIYKEGGLSKALKIFGGKDIEIGIPEFDRDYRVKSNDAEQTARLFENDKFRNLLTENIANGLFDISDNKGLFTKKENVTMSHVLYRQTGEITDHDWIKTLFMMVGYTLDLMGEIGKATEMSVSEMAYSHEDKR